LRGDGYTNAQLRSLSPLRLLPAGTMELRMSSADTSLAWAVDGPPIGVWRTELGTADVLMSDTICFLPDGAGYWLQHSALSGADVFGILWKHVEPGVLGLEWLFEAESEDEDEDGDEITFGRVRYRAATVQTDASAGVHILRDVDGEKFWWLAGPIGYAGPPTPEWLAEVEKFCPYSREAMVEMARKAERNFALTPARPWWKWRGKRSCPAGETAFGARL
jgi:hypothetical protein